MPKHAPTWSHTRSSQFPHIARVVCLRLPKCKKLVQNLQKASPFFGSEKGHSNMQKPTPFCKKLVWNSSREDSHYASFGMCLNDFPLLSEGHPGDSRARLLVGCLVWEDTSVLPGRRRPLPARPKNPLITNSMHIFSS